MSNLERQIFWNNLQDALIKSVNEVYEKVTKGG